MADDTHPTHLSPSELGTKDYWETFYARTLAHLSTKQTPTSNSNSKSRSKSSSTRLPHHRVSNSNADDTDSQDEDDDDDEDEEDDIDDDDDPGTSWFSEHNAPDKVLQFLTGEEFPLSPGRTTRVDGTQGEEKEREGSQIRNQPCLLDLGTGNGSMLALLRKKGKFAGDMVGVDYSPRSVELARELQRLRIHSAYLSDSDDDDDSDFGDDDDDDSADRAGGEEKKKENENKDKDTNIRFEEWDILSSTDALSGSGDGERRLDWFPYAKGGFDIVLDKGTFDAVSLSDETVEMGSGSGSGSANEPSGEASSKTTGSGTKKIQRRVCERYPDIARRLVRKGGFLVVTSCNWTEEELVQWFTRSEGDESDRLQVWGRVEYPRFRFGGKEGQGVCTVCFQRV